MDNHNSAKTSGLIYVLYYLIIIILFSASFFPDFRIWGFNNLHFFSLPIKLILSAIAIAVPIVLKFQVLSIHSQSSNKFYLISFSIIIFFAFLFYFLRAKTFFLGDGYALLTNLASDYPLLKNRNLGESFIHLWLKYLIAGDSKQAALLSYRMISYISGVATLITTTYFAKAVFKSNLTRVLFLLGIASSGFMLLSFGYVENYSIFCLTALIFGMVGILISLNKIHKGWIVLAFIISLLTHIMGITLLPALVYVLINRTKLIDLFYKQRSFLKTLIVAAIILIPIIIIVYFYYTSYFFRFAFVPFWTDEFTVEGYTLFSVNHLADVFNLYFMLLPGLPLFIFSYLIYNRHNELLTDESIFLFIMTIFTFGGVLIFDPKLGMPRDWDLFSFASIPIVLLVYYLFLKDNNNNYIKVSMLSIMLGFFLLAPRIYSIASEETAIKQFRIYSELDFSKNRLAQLYLINYYLDKGDSAKAAIEKEIAVNDFKEEKLLNKAKRIFNEGKFWEATQLLEEAIKLNPTYVDAHYTMGECYMEYKSYEKALHHFEVAGGLSPNRHYIQNDIGVAAFALKEYDKAEKAFYKALRFNPNLNQTIFNLIVLYAETNQFEKYQNKINHFSTLEDTDYQIIKQIAENCLSQRKFKMASSAYHHALELGMDSTEYQTILINNPKLKTK